MPPGCSLRALVRVLAQQEPPAGHCWQLRHSQIQLLEQLLIAIATAESG